MILYRHSGLFNRQGLDTVYEDYFALLLSSPLLTTRQFIETHTENKQKDARFRSAVSNSVVS